jgi:hypothetical protein
MAGIWRFATGYKLTKWRGRLGRMNGKGKLPPIAHMVLIECLRGWIVINRRPATVYLLRTWSCTLDMTGIGRLQTE